MSADLTRYEDIPEVWTRVTDTRERDVLVQFPYPIHRPHLPTGVGPAAPGAAFACEQVSLIWRKRDDLPWRLWQVRARGRFVKHNAHLSGNDVRERTFGAADIDTAPPLLRALVAEHTPREDTP